jgi:uncharacterized DUF497 family protein
MRFEWDVHKDRINRRKHKVSFATAVLVFDDPAHLSVQDRSVDGEERWQTLGCAGGVVILLVAHTWREADGEEVVRIISARKATVQERRRYEKASE